LGDRSTMLAVTAKFKSTRLLKEVGKRVRGKGERANKNPFPFTPYPFPNKDVSLSPQECKKQLIARGLG
jgi:hypothetical protein